MTRRMSLNQPGANVQSSSVKTTHCVRAISRAAFNARDLPGPSW